MAHTETIEKAVADGIVERDSSESQFFRRKKFIVDSRLQFGIIGSFALLLAIFLFVLTACIFGPPIVGILLEGKSSHDLVKNTTQLMALDARYWPALGVAALLVLAMAIKVTHRLAGPLYRFKCIFEELGGNTVPNAFKLRNGDYLMHEAELLNRALDRVRGRASALASLQSELKILKSNMEKEGESKHAKAIAHILKNHEQALLESSK